MLLVLFGNTQFSQSAFLHCLWQGDRAEHIAEGFTAQKPKPNRALQIGCTKVHQDNGKWMPCADERELHRQLRKQLTNEKFDAVQERFTVGLFP